MAIPRDSSREGGRAEEKYLRGMQRSEGIIPRFSPLCLGAVQTSGTGSLPAACVVSPETLFPNEGKDQESMQCITFDRSIEASRVLRICIAMATGDSLQETEREIRQIRESDDTA